jgi:hypothetical protein
VAAPAPGADDWCAGVGRRDRVPITLVGSLFMVAALAFALAGRRHEFAAALSA